MGKEFPALMLVFLERPSAWGAAARLLAAAMDGNGSGLLNMLLPQFDGLIYDPDLSRLAVSCLDAPRPKHKEDFPTPELLADVALQTIQNVSRHFGASMSWNEPDGGCQFWPVEESDRFIGPWNHTLSNPILIVSNTVSSLQPDFSTN